MPDPVFMNHASGLHIVAAVLGHLGPLSLTPPLDRLHARGGLFYPAGGIGHGVEPHPVADFFLEAHHQIQGGHGGEVENRVGG